MTRSRGYKKRERTRRQLLDAGAKVLAEKGDALTISDVVATAEVSNGTFYNYFSDRDALIDALAEDSLVSLAATSANDSAEADPARSFALATARVLERAFDDPVWGSAILRLADHERSVSNELLHHLRADLSHGYAQERFRFGPDAATLDLVIGLITASIRRLLRREAGRSHIAIVLARALLALGVDEAEAAAIAAEAVTHEAAGEVAARSGAALAEE